MSLIDSYDSLLLDLDGTVWEGGRAIPHAVETITTSGLPVMYITNNASRGPATVARKLRAIGLDAARSAVLTSAEAAIDLASKEIPAGSTVLVLGSNSFQQLAAEAGFVLANGVEDAPAAVLHGHNPATGWTQLTEAALSIRKGARYYASNTDATLPDERGLCVGNGSMVQAVVHATGVSPAVAGKPEPAMFSLAAEKLDSQSPLAVGDRLNTDILGANRAGQDSLLVLTGVSGLYELLAATPEERPTYIGADMRALLHNKDDLLPRECGGFQSHVDRDTVVVSGGSPAATWVDFLKTALSVAWPQGITSVVAEGEVAEAALAQQW